LVIILSISINQDDDTIDNDEDPSENIKVGLAVIHSDLHLIFLLEASCA
jgi:hypothetical protein